MSALVDYAAARRAGAPALARLPVHLLVAVAVLVPAAPAAAVPAFARKYGTSCLTCHTIYPKLTPFGEAFRRNGYRFPGVDSDFVKQETVALGQDANKKEFPHAVWPGSLPASVPLAVGFNGAAAFHPSKKSSGGVADNGARLNLQDWLAEGHLWVGGSFDDKITFFGELTVSRDGAEVEHATVHFNDLFGPRHLLNLVAGKNVATLTSFGPHSSYLTDFAYPALSVTSLYGGSSDSWNVMGAYNGVELNGTIAGRLNYAVGANAGANNSVRPTENVYAHVGYKLGGVRLDGENGSSVPDPKKPWAETALTVDLFYYRSVSRFTTSDPSTEWNDSSHAFGGSLRAQWRSLELDAGAYQERHNHALLDGSGVNTVAQFDELSYVVFPWLVPAARFELLRLSPAGAPSIYDVRVLAGVDFLVRANLKFTLVLQLEKASGAPDGTWVPAGGIAAGATGVEVEAINLGMAFAF